MASCATCARALTLPPTLDYLRTTYPTVVPLYTINRQIPRFQQCDHVSAYKKIMDAELPPPDYKNPVQEVEKNIMRAYELIEEGIQAEQLQAVLPRMWKVRAERIRERDEGIRRACGWFWGIWGKVGLESFLP